MLTLSLVVCLVCATLGGVLSLDNGIARTPPMGWIAWERFTCTVDCQEYPNDCIHESLFKQMADRMVDDGYAKVGYKYINIDDCWSEIRRNSSSGDLLADAARFPQGIAKLADYMHSKNLLLGIYGDCGTATCAGYPAQLKSSSELEDNYFVQDANQLAKWQVDSFKFDGCNLEANKQERICPKMAQALERSGRPILLSCEYPFYMLRHHLAPDWTLVAQSCNTWRYFEDIEDAWLSVLNVVDYTINLQTTIVKVHGPGQWFDADQLVVGNYALSLNQARAQMALWCIWSAPLYMGNDLRSIAPEMKQILQNEKLIGVNQDPLGLLGLMVAEQDERRQQAFVKPVLPGAYGCPSFVVLYLNRAHIGNTREISFNLRQLLTKVPVGLAAQRQQMTTNARNPMELIRAEECKQLLARAMTRLRAHTPPPGLLVTPASVRDGSATSKPPPEIPLEEKQVSFSVEDLFGDQGAPSSLNLDSDLTISVNPSGVRALKLTIIGVN